MSGVVRRFMEDIERLAPKPFLKMIRGCFGDSDELLEVIHVDIEGEKATFSSDEITGCGDSALARSVGL